MKQVAGKIKLELAQYREMASFAQFASDLDSSTKKLIDRGDRLTELLKQPQYAPMKLEEQVVGIFIGVNGFLDNLPINKVRDFEKFVLSKMRIEHPDILNQIRDKKEVKPETAEILKGIIANYVDIFEKE